MNISSKIKGKIALFLLCAVLCWVIACALISVVAAIQRPSTTHFLTTFGLGAGVYVWFDILLSEAKFQGWKEGYREASDKWQKWAEIKNEDGAIIRLLALLVRAPTDDDGRPEIECSRETLVNMAMAARKELDALRAKTKDEEE